MRRLRLHVQGILGRVFWCKLSASPAKPSKDQIHTGTRRNSEQQPCSRNYEKGASLIPQASATKQQNREATQPEALEPLGTTQATKTIAPSLFGLRNQALPGLITEFIAHLTILQVHYATFSISMHVYIYIHATSCEQFMFLEGTLRLMASRKKSSMPHLVKATFCSLLTP